MFWEAFNQIFLYLTAGITALFVLIGLITIGMTLGNILGKLILRLVRWIGRLVIETEED
jgi:hypothetical protein